MTAQGARRPRFLVALSLVQVLLASWFVLVSAMGLAVGDRRAAGVAATVSAGVIPPVFAASVLGFAAALACSILLRLEGRHALLTAFWMQAVSFTAVACGWVLKAMSFWNGRIFRVDLGVAFIAVIIGAIVCGMVIRTLWPNLWGGSPVHGSERFDQDCGNSS